MPFFFEYSSEITGVVVNVARLFAFCADAGSMAEWWAAASWRKKLVVVVDMLFAEMVMAPLHCAAAQLVVHACRPPPRTLRRAPCDACHRFCCRGAHRCGGFLAVALLHGSLVVAFFAYVGFSIFMQGCRLSGLEFI